MRSWHCAPFYFFAAERADQAFHPAPLEKVGQAFAHLAGGFGFPCPTLQLELWMQSAGPREQRRKATQTMFQKCKFWEPRSLEVVPPLGVIIGLTSGGRRDEKPTVVDCPKQIPWIVIIQRRNVGPW